MGTTNYYSNELKKEIIDQVKQSGKSVSQIAKEYGLNPRTVYGWIKKGFNNSGTLLELNRLRRQNKELITLIGQLTVDLKKNR